MWIVLLPEANQLWTVDQRMADSKSTNDRSSREHLLLSQNHAVVAIRMSSQDFVRARTCLRRFGTDRDEHGSDGGVCRDRRVRGTRLFRRGGEERYNGSEGVDIVQPELEGLGAKVFVPARTPLLASMGRWVILSNGKKAIRNSAKRMGNKDEGTDRDEHRQTTSSKARSQHASLRIPRCLLVGGEERVTMKIPGTGG